MVLRAAHGSRCRGGGCRGNCEGGRRRVCGYGRRCCNARDVYGSGGGQGHGRESCATDRVGIDVFGARRRNANHSIRNLNRRRGMVGGMEDSAGGKIISAEVPLAEMFGYATDLRSATQGRATYSMEFAQYAETPNNVANAVISKTR